MTIEKLGFAMHSSIFVLICHLDIGVKNVGELL